MKKRTFLGMSFGLLIFIVGLFGVYYWFFKPEEKKETIKIGILHSLTGSMASFERPVVDAVKMALEEINASGGVLGKQLEFVMADGKSDEIIFAKEAERLITQEKVVVLFGCWTSASRKRVKEVVEKHKHLLVYPIQYEGVEESSHIIYLGSTPNQTIIPGVTWSFYNLGKRFYLVGSDYVFPRVANEIIKLHIESLGGSVVGEGYIPLGKRKVEPIINDIIKTKPDVILNTINGDTNVPFFQELREKGITPEKIPTMSFSVSEPELKALDIATMVGDYAAWNYFQILDDENNRAFIQRYKKMYGEDRTVSNNILSAYAGVYLWAKAVESVKSVDISFVIPAMRKQVFNAPGGVFYLDDNNHVWGFSLIGKINIDGQFDIVWSSGQRIQPIPYPPYKNKKVWQDFLIKLYKGWGDQWAYTPA